MNVIYIFITNLLWYKKNECTCKKVNLMRLSVSLCLRMSCYVAFCHQCLCLQVSSYLHNSRLLVFYLRTWFVFTFATLRQLNANETEAILHSIRPISKIRFPTQNTRQRRKSCELEGGNIYKSGKCDKRQIVVGKKWRLMQSSTFNQTLMYNVILFANLWWYTNICFSSIGWIRIIDA